MLHLQGINNPRIYLLDASIYVFRAWFASSYSEMESDESVSSAALIYYRHLKQFFQRQNVKYCVTAFDESLGSGFRHQLCDEYKADRALPDEILNLYLTVCRELTESLGIQCLSSNEFEADDILASLAAAVKTINPSYAITVLTRDKDLFQLLLDEQDEWLDFSKLSDIKSVSREGVYEKMGVKPYQISDFLALRGDKIDGITGINGVGDKTAALLMAEFDSLDRLISAVSSGSDVLSSLSFRGKVAIIQRIGRVEHLLRKNQALTVLVKDIVAVRRQFISLTDFLIETLNIQDLYDMTSLAEWVTQMTANHRSKLAF